MKLPDVVRGPVTLSKIDYAPLMSQETAAFVATICYEGIGCADVRNDGHGGANFIDPLGVGREIERAVEAYAEDLPPYRDEHGELSMNGDFLISLMVDEAIQAREAGSARARESDPSDYDRFEFEAADRAYREGRPLLLIAPTFGSTRGIREWARHTFSERSTEEAEKMAAAFGRPNLAYTFMRPFRFPHHITRSAGPDSSACAATIQSVAAT